MKAVVLAAGKGSRIGSEQEGLPKVMRSIGGKPMIDYVLSQLSEAQEIILVVGYQREKVYAHLADKYSYAVQDEQLGTGHAIKCASEFFCDYDGPVLVTFGDMPLLTESTYQSMLAQYNESVHSGNTLSCILLSVELQSRKLPYGRVIRENGEFVRIVEEVDCNPEELLIKEVFSGVMLFNGIDLCNALKRMTNDNAQNEYYMTDLPAILKEEGKNISIYSISDEKEVYGVNTVEDLRIVEQILKNKG